MTTTSSRPGPAVTDAPAAPARPVTLRRRVRRRLAMLLSVAAFVAAVVLTSLPLLTHTAGPASAPFTPSVPLQNKGVYLQTTSGVLQLFSWTDPRDSFPSDAPTLPQGSVRQVVVVQNAFDSPGSYLLYRYGSAGAVPWQVSQVTGHRLDLVPTQLPPGRYLFLSRTDDSFAENTYQYFVVAASSGGGA